MASLYFVRHGQASFGAANYDALSVLGQRQCRHLGEWWRERGWKIPALVTGPMQRHLQSLQAFQQGVADGGAYVTLEQLAEFDHEDVLTVYRPEFKDMAAIAHFLSSSPNPRKAFQQTFVEAADRWHSGEHDADYKEPWPVFRDRVLNGFQHLLDAGESRLVFTSGGVISVIMQQVLKTTDSKSFALNSVIANSSVSRFLFSGGEVSLSTFNNTAHLDIHNAPELISYR